MNPLFRSTPDGFEVQPPRRAIERHLHREGHVSVVLRGEYTEAGDQGRRRLKPGDVLIHQPFEAHANAIGGRGAQMISLKLPIDAPARWRQGRLRDLDAVIRLAGRDAVELWALVGEDTAPGVLWEADWPDLLASALRRDPGLVIGDWAEDHGLTPGSVSRGFRAAYGVSPKRFRATNRARSAWSGLMAGRSPHDVVDGLGFSDQAHLCREIRALTGASPAFWRAKSVQYPPTPTR